jgi:hypothetical protein
MMNRQYFELEDDVDLDGRWLLGGLSDHTGRELDVEVFDGEFAGDEAGQEFVALNPNGIPSQSPGLRGTSYPG